MPCLRGIEMSLFSNPVDQKFPEYPHPDGSSVRLQMAPGIQPFTTPRANNTDISNSPDDTPRSTVRIPKTDPRVSVYIPSRSGTQFSVQYTVTNVPVEPCKFLFFKLYINGRLMTAWGCNLEEKLTGTIGRTLWAPSGQWQNDVGIEGRQLMFMPALEHKTAADDGGLIEVRAFRAKDRRPRAPKLETFRHQQQYGIAAPSTGMIDKPEDVTYYQWHLIDPKDSPYAKFSFHYRTIQSLRQLSLVPPEPGNRHRTALGVANTVCESPSTPRNPEEGQTVQDSCFPFLVRTYHAVSHDDAVSFDSGSPAERAQAEEVAPKKSPERKKQQKAVLRTPPPLRPLIARDGVPQPSKALRDVSGTSYLRRPLPELPLSMSTPTRQLRSPSPAASLAPSLSPSVEQSFEDRVFDSDDIEIGETHHVQIKKVIKRPTRLELDRTPQSHATDVSIADYETSLPLTHRCLTPPLGSPSYVATTGASLRRSFELFSIREVSGHTPSPTRPPPAVPSGHVPSPTRPAPALPSELDGSSPYKTYADTRSFAEWMGGRPSPVLRADSPPLRAPGRWSYPTRRGARVQTATRLAEDGTDDEVTETDRRSFDSVKENMPPEYTLETDTDGNWI